MNRKGNRGVPLMAVGLLLLAAALCLAIYNTADDLRAGSAAESAAIQLRQLTEAAALEKEESGVESLAPDYLLTPDMEMPTVEIDGQRYIGTLSIPVLDKTLPVLSQWSYPNLKLGPCRYSGSAYRDDLVIAAHNYRSHFGSLKTLLPGNEVIFADVDGNEFVYTVTELEILQPTDLERLQEGDWDLTLFTCTLGGQTRCTVRCVLADKW